MSQESWTQTFVGQVWVNCGDVLGLGQSAPLHGGWVEHALTVQVLSDEFTRTLVAVLVHMGEVDIVDEAEKSFVASGHKVARVFPFQIVVQHRPDGFGICGAGMKREPNLWWFIVSNQRD